MSGAADEDERDAALRRIRWAGLVSVVAAGLFLGLIPAAVEGWLPAGGSGSPRPGQGLAELSGLVGTALWAGAGAVVLAALGTLALEDRARPLRTGTRDRVLAVLGGLVSVPGACLAAWFVVEVLGR